MNGAWCACSKIVIYMHQLLYRENKGMVSLSGWSYWLAKGEAGHTSDQSVTCNESPFLHHLDWMQHTSTYS